MQVGLRAAAARQVDLLHAAAATAQAVNDIGACSAAAAANPGRAAPAKGLAVHAGSVAVCCGDRSVSCGGRVSHGGGRACRG
eukprot:162759-Chlamydomonas_euryale.AAC.3